MLTIGDNVKIAKMPQVVNHTKTDSKAIPDSTPKTSKAKSSTVPVKTKSQVVDKAAKVTGKRSFLKRFYVILESTAVKSST